MPVTHSVRGKWQVYQFQPIDNLEQSVVDDVEYIKNHPLAAANILIYGYSYDVNTGRLIEVEKATEISRAK